MAYFESPDALLSALAERLKQLRISKGLTQGDLATRANLSRQAISDLESSGKSSLQTLSRFLYALGEGRVIDSIAPQTTFSPMAAPRGMTIRKRVMPKRQKGETA